MIYNIHLVATTETEKMKVRKIIYHKHLQQSLQKLPRITIYLTYMLKYIYGLHLS